MKFLNIANQKGLIEDVIVHRLKVNRDDRGVLVETLKSNWEELYGNHRPFTQTYYSITIPGTARDEKLWHVHKFQEDRFIVISGDLVIALYDNRKDKSTYKTLNLFTMGEKEGDDGQYLLLVPPDVCHGYCVVSSKSAIMLNFPTHLYNPDDEGRIPLIEIGAILDDGSLFSWKKVLAEFK